MPRLDFTADWTVERAASKESTPVHLPHDAMVHELRDPETPNGKNSGYFPGGQYTYRKRFKARAAWQGSRVSLFIEGAYHRSTVSLNGERIGGRACGYAGFHTDLDAALRYGEENELAIAVDTSDEPNSRWYSGSGLYRPVWLDVAPAIGIARDGVIWRTLSIDGETAVEVRVVGAAIAQGLTIAVDLLAAGESVAQATCPATGHDTLHMTVPQPRLWSADTPFLYELVVQLFSGEEIADEWRERVGVRTIEVDTRHGLRINGVPTKLRGGCVHHDSGVLGAATFADAELRRARIIKCAGFNAIRSGHSPMSRALLNACDEVGLYVMEELTDVWFSPKTKFDYAADFGEWWRADLDSMVAKCRNHPCVLFYSIGNENSETQGEAGIAVGREMAERCRAADPTRPVTAGVNLMLNGLASLGIGVFNPEKTAKPGKPGKQLGTVGSAFFNLLMGKLGTILNSAGRLRRVDRATAGIFDVLDIAGYNYGTRSYEQGHRRHPERVIVGTESLPGDVAKIWPRIGGLPYVIGDFMWTAQDYLGEAGLSGWSYDRRRPIPAGNFPWLTSGGGAIDLIGTPGAAVLLAQAVWGLSASPHIVVRPLDLVHQKTLRSPWRSSDAIPSWSWRGHEGELTTVTVYADADTAELRQDGRCVGIRPAGPAHGYAADFRVPYSEGELLAIARANDGTETGRSILRSAAGSPKVTLDLDRSSLAANGQDLAFVEVSIADDAGIIVPLSSIALRTQVTGAVSLAGLGSANPAPTGNFFDNTTQTYRGRALAVLRAGLEPGPARLTIETDCFGTAAVDLLVTANNGISRLTCSPETPPV